MGYKAHLTESCDADAPELVTHVETTVATITDVQMTAPIHEGLARQELLPAEHTVDTGYVDGELLSEQPTAARGASVGSSTRRHQLASQGRQGVCQCKLSDRLVGPLCDVSCWADHYRWTPLDKPERLEIVFARTTCAPCPHRADCTLSQTAGRVLHLRPQVAHEALQARRQEQETTTFREQYAVLAAIEATLSQGVRVMGLRRARYIVLYKTHLQHVLTAVAINVVRLDAYLTGTPRGRTRQSHFAKLRNHFPSLQQAA